MLAQKEGKSHLRSRYQSNYVLKIIYITQPNQVDICVSDLTHKF